MDDSLLPPTPQDHAQTNRPIKGRGAASNPEGRFESSHQAEDDGWSHELLDEDTRRPRTEVTEARAQRDQLQRLAGHRFHTGHQPLQGM